MKNLLIVLFIVSVVTTLKGQVAEKVKRPQEPEKPYPYLSEDVTFKNLEANITLSGTLTLPSKSSDFPVVILISGSSPHNRNQEIAGHKSFLVIADHLTKNGIGVLRYDDRGVGQSEGEYQIAAYADRASDVASALAYLKTRKEVDDRRIGLIGHSEGGLIAPIVAAQTNDVSFVVMLAAPTLPGGEIILLQTERNNKALGISDVQTQAELAFLGTVFDAVVKADDLQQTKSDLSKTLKGNPENLPDGMEVDDIDKILETFTAPWFLRILTYDPRLVLKKVKCPVLAMTGEKDLQIPPDENLSAVNTTLRNSGNQHATVMKLEGLNHLFQETETGLSDEFATIEQTISPIALNEMTKWIQNTSGSFTSK